MTISLAVASAAIFGVAFVPLPYHVDCAVEIEPNDAQQVFAMVPGRLVTWHKRPGDRVEPNETIAQLDNIDLHIQLLQRKSEYELALNRYGILEDQQYFDPQAKAQLDTQAQIVLSKEELVKKAQDRIDMLNVKSKAAGVILPPPTKPVAKQAEADEQLPTWSGNPFDAKNQEAYFSQSDLLCLVGEPTRMEAVLVVDQHDVDLVKVGDEADIKIDSARLETFSGKIREDIGNGNVGRSRKPRHSIRRTPGYRNGFQRSTAADFHFLSSACAARKYRRPLKKRLPWPSQDLCRLEIGRMENLSILRPDVPLRNVRNYLTELCRTSTSACLNY